MANDERDTDHEKDHQIAEDHLAKQRGPVEREEGADAAESKRRHHSNSKGKACGDKPQAIVDGLKRVLVETSADRPRRLSKQPFDAKAQTYKHGKQQQALNPPVRSQVCGDEAVCRLDLIGQIGERGAECDNVLSDRGDMGVELVRYRISFGVGFARLDGLGLALLFQPIAHVRIGQQCHQLLDFLRCRLAFRGRRRFPGFGGRRQGAGKRPDR